MQHVSCGGHSGTFHDTIPKYYLPSTVCTKRLADVDTHIQHLSSAYSLAIDQMPLNGLMTPWRTVKKVTSVRKTLMRTSHTPYPPLRKGRWGTAPLSPTLPLP
ncbi:hypothetical protein F7725_024574 [Dissostichus mawsoni]|uniref:Uncharacterized protein n=1 Tax=Dissostichus mawsoni TaxID=36200 RepID=A0A7J5Y0M8_DISMA|nr:hypothetical protein F7725_024574 [Dissostichus mawsoni]